jgi:UDP-N-acetylmuramoyl-tripeptide--D-alanyl-D-alanine ligase
MRELGPHSEALHRQVGRRAAQAGLALLVGVGGDARHLADEARHAGLPPQAVRFLDDPVEAGEFLRGALQAGDLVLFKASRAVRLERAIEKLAAD